MFLSPRDPTTDFSPDICGRVTFVNFTMTRSSLQSQLFRLGLRALEELLLQVFNESTGNILDDDKVIDTLETRKRDAADITSKVDDTVVVMREVEQVE